MINSCGCRGRVASALNYPLSGSLTGMNNAAFNLGRPRLGMVTLHDRVGSRRDLIVSTGAFWDDLEPGDARRRPAT